MIGHQNRLEIRAVNSTKLCNSDEMRRQGNALLFSHLTWRHCQFHPKASVLWCDKAFHLELHDTIYVNNIEFNNI